MPSPLIVMALLVAACLALAAGLAGRGVSTRGQWTHLRPETRLLLIGLGLVTSAACYALSGRLDRDMGEPPDTSEVPPPAAAQSAPAAPAPQPVVAPAAAPAASAAAPPPAATSPAAPATARPSATPALPLPVAAPPPPARALPAATAANPVVSVPATPCPLPMLHLQVLDHLHRSQAHEHLALWIEGRQVAEFDVDGRHRFDRADVRLPWPGRLRYVLRGQIDWADGRSSAVVGEGCINVRRGRHFRIYNDGTQPQPALFLRRAR